MGTRQLILWSDQLDQIIKDNRGKISASLIAKIIGGGCTRCAVIGRARRLGLETLAKSDPEKTIRRKDHLLRKTVDNYQVHRKERKPPRPQKPIPVVDAEIPFEQRRQLLELGLTDCRWPVGDPGTPEFFFCGAISLDGNPYCPAHSWRSRSHEQAVRKAFVFRRAA